MREIGKETTETDRGTVILVVEVGEGIEMSQGEGRVARAVHVVAETEIVEAEEEIGETIEETTSGEMTGETVTVIVKGRGRGETEEEMTGEETSVSILVEIEEMKDAKKSPNILPAIPLKQRNAALLSLHKHPLILASHGLAAAS